MSDKIKTLPPKVKPLLTKTQEFHFRFPVPVIPEQELTEEVINEIQEQMGRSMCSLRCGDDGEIIEEPCIYSIATAMSVFADQHYEKFLSWANNTQPDFMQRMVAQMLRNNPKLMRRVIKSLNENKTQK